MILFTPGKIVATPGVFDELTEKDIFPCLIRHTMGDYGDLSKEDKEANDAAVTTGERILSAYTVKGVKFWIITEWDRSVTTFLLPSEY